MKRHRRPILIRLPSSKRREPLLKPGPLLSEVAEQSTGYPVPRTRRMHGGKITKAHVAEAVGSTAAECAAVCCCFPCGIVNLVVLVGYRVPASLCRKAWRRRRRLQQLTKKGMLPSEDGEMRRKPGGKEELVVVVGQRNKDEVAERLEKEMWERFHNTGFWRSPSQREQQLKKKTDRQNQGQDQNRQQV